LLLKEQKRRKARSIQEAKVITNMENYTLTYIRLERNIYNSRDAEFVLANES